MDCTATVTFAVAAVTAALAAATGWLGIRAAQERLCRGTC